MIYFLAILLILISIFMVMVVLVQRGRGGGLSGAFGSGGGSNSAFGTKTGDVFTTVTVIFFVVFMLLSIVLSLKYRWASGGPPAPAVATTAPLGMPSLPGSTSPPTTGITTLPAMVGPPSTAVAPPVEATTRPAATHP